MSNKVFLDCLGREIKVGDVLANGHRIGSCRAGLTLGVVTGFKDGKILAKKLQSGYWFEYDGKRSWCGYGGDLWRFYDGYWYYGDRCFITGMSEDDLRKLVVIDESEVSQ
jgi:hypothetical protein